jgi:hypothetical protein
MASVETRTANILTVHKLAGTEQACPDVSTRACVQTSRRGGTDSAYCPAPTGTRRSRVHRTRGGTLPRTGGAAPGIAAANWGRGRIAQCRVDADGNAPAATNAVTGAGGSRSTVRAQHVDPGSRSRNPRSQALPAGAGRRWRRRLICSGRSTGVGSSG